MNTSERNFWLKIQRALLLAASDMEQATAAARALEAESEDHNLMLALETGMAVCYARAFTQSSLFRLSKSTYEPADQQPAQMHHRLCLLRNKRYAHTDKKGGRSASLSVQAATGLGNLGGLPMTVGFLRHDEWAAFPREDIDTAVELFALQRERFHEEAGKIELLLGGPENYPS